MKRTQIYVDEDLWERLEQLAKIDKVSVSELIRRAVKEKYSEMTKEERIAAVRQAWGLWKDRDDIGDTDEYLRRLRSGDRLERLWKE